MRFEIPARASSVEAVESAEMPEIGSPKVEIKKNDARPKPSSRMLESIEKSR